MIEIENNLRRADALIEINRPQDAHRLVSAVVAAAPDNFRAYCLLARCYSMTGNTEMMLAAADQATVRNPDHEWGHRLRSMALRGLGRHEEALAAATTAVRIAPLVWQPYVNLTEALLRFPGVAQRKLAYEAATRAVHLAPNVTSTHVTLGRVYVSIGARDEAAACYERALAINPMDPTALTNLGSLALLRGRLAQASRTFRTVAASHPSVETFANNVGVAASRWNDRALDLAACACVAQFVAHFAAPAPFGALVAFGIVALYAATIAIMYGRLPAAMRVLVRHDLRTANSLPSKAIGVVMVLTLLPAIDELAAGAPTPARLFDLILLSGLTMMRFPSAIRRWAAPRLLQRQYRAAIFGDRAGPAIPRQRPEQP